MTVSLNMCEVVDVESFIGSIGETMKELAVIMCSSTIGYDSLIVITQLYMYLYVFG